MTIAWVPKHPGSLSARQLPPAATESVNIERSARESYSSQTPAVAFAIGRRVGPAVVRNRLRRRLRHELRDMARAGDLADGCYLVGLGPEAASISAVALGSHVRGALQQRDSSPEGKR